MHGNHHTAAYPIRSIASAKDYDPAWVAVEKGVSVGVYGTSDITKFFDGDAEWRIRKDGDFATSGNNSVDGKICLNEQTGLFSNVKNDCGKSNYRFLTLDEINAMKDEKNIILKTNFLIALSTISFNGGNGNGNGNNGAGGGGGNSKLIQIMDKPEE